MPPIEALDPPKGAEYLVGSIQTYLLKRFALAPQELLVNYRSNEDLVAYARTLGYLPYCFSLLRHYDEFLGYTDIAKWHWATDPYSFALRS